MSARNSRKLSPAGSNPARSSSVQCQGRQFRLVVEVEAEAELDVVDVVPRRNWPR